MTSRLLTDGDRRLYRALCASAKAGDPCPSTHEIMEFMNYESDGAPAAALTRLEQAALIRIRRYQQHRVVTITATGDTTAEPNNPKTHWRDRPFGQASAALKIADSIEPGIADEIREWSVQTGQLLPDLIGNIMASGFRLIQQPARKGRKAA